MFYAGCKYIFSKYPRERSPKALAFQPRGRLSHRELDNDATHSSPVKLAYVSYKSTVQNKSSETANTSPIIVLHGILNSKRSWDSLSKTINQRTSRQVIAADIRNHGGSPHSSDMAYPVMAKDVARLVKDLGHEKAVMIGHSMGGRTLIYLALNYPELVEKLVVVDVSPTFTSPAMKSVPKILHAIQNIRLDENVSFSEVHRTVEQQLSTFVKSAIVRKILLENLVEVEPGKYKWCLNLPAIEKNFDTICGFPRIVNKTFNGPTLFVGGSQSDFLPLNGHEEIKELFPAAKFEYIPEAGHAIHAQKPQELINTIIPFINETK